MLAGITGASELELDAAEAKALAGGIKRVAQLYPVGLSEKKLAWINLSMIAGGIYGTRVVAMWRKPKAKPKAQVIEMPAPTGPSTMADATEVKKPTPPAKIVPPSPSSVFGFQDANIEGIF